MTRETEKREYFLSFNSADAEFAQALSGALETAGISHHFANRDVPHGGNIAVWMDRALANSVRVLALCSPDYFKEEAKWSEAERSAAFWADPDGAKARLVPVEIRDTEFTPLYAPLKRVIVKGMLQDAAIAAILEALASDEQSRQQEAVRTAERHPEVFRVGRPRLTTFDGHFDALAGLQTSLAQGHNAAVTQAISGMGGIGKTTLAAEYAHRFGTQGRYGGVWWVDSETSVPQGLAGLAPHWNALQAQKTEDEREPSIPVTDNLPEQARTVRDWLGARTRPWLVIFDNAQNPDQVRDWLPVGSARVILTSRFDDWTGLADRTRLDIWGKETTTDYLLANTGRDDRAGAEALARVLDGLPLAADQAAAFLRPEGEHATLSFADYSAEIAEIIAMERADGVKGAYEATVYATLVKSVETLPEASQDLLCLLSWLSPDGVDLELLVRDTQEEPHFIPDRLRSALAGKLSRGPLIAAAARLSLLRTDGEGDGVVLIVHRITQTVLHRWQRVTGRTGWDGHATGLVNAAFPFDADDDPSTWERCQSLLPHALALADHGPRQGEPGQWRGRLLNQAGLFLGNARGDTDGAIALIGPAVYLAHEIHGERSEQYTSALSNLSGRYIDAGRYAEAEAGLLRVLEIEEDLLGATHPKIAITLNNLARAYWKQQFFDRAEPLFQRALEIGKLPTNDGTYNVAGGLNALGALYDDWAEQLGQRHRRGRARDLKEQALATARAARGERHPEVSACLHNLAVLFTRTDDLARAADLERRAAAILVSLWGWDHPEVRESLNHLLQFLDRAGQGIAPNDLGKLLIHEILAVEAGMAKWVEQDPGTRHFGPQSFFADKPKLLAQVQAAMDADD